MCTALILKAKNGDVVMGRTMDFSHVLNPKLYRIPAGYHLKGISGRQSMKTNYSLLGVGQSIPGHTLADGTNEQGLSVAALYFPEYAYYDKTENAAAGRPGIASIDVVLFLLGMCSSTKHAVSILHNIDIIGTEDAITKTVAPLHWIVCDKHGHCITVEKTIQGLNIYKNSPGILANSPDFSWHMTNLENYIHVVPTQTEKLTWGSTYLAQPGQAGGTKGLPGDFTPAGRFVRAAWLKAHTDTPKDGASAIQTGFQILGNVSIPRGCVITKNGIPDYTQYTVFFNLTAFTAYIRRNDADLYADAFSYD